MNSLTSRVCHRLGSHAAPEQKLRNLCRWCLDEDLCIYRGMPFSYGWDVILPIKEFFQIPSTSPISMCDSDELNGQANKHASHKSVRLHDLSLVIGLLRGTLGRIQVAIMWLRHDLTGQPTTKPKRRRTLKQWPPT